MHRRCHWRLQRRATRARGIGARIVDIISCCIGIVWQAMHGRHAFGACKGVEGRAVEMTVVVCEMRRVNVAVSLGQLYVGFWCSSSTGGSSTSAALPSLPLLDISGRFVCFFAAVPFVDL